jgi:RNA polymerase sigma factor (sigma-70 family)
VFALEYDALTETDRWLHSASLDLAAMRRRAANAKRSFAIHRTMTSELFAATRQLFPVLSPPIADRLRALILGQLGPSIDECVTSLSKLREAGLVSEVRMAIDGGSDLSEFLDWIGSSVDSRSASEAQAFIRVLSRPARTTGWRKVMHRSMPRGLRAWLRRAVRGLASDWVRTEAGRRPGSISRQLSQTEKGGAADIELIVQADQDETQRALLSLAQAADLTPRQVEVMELQLVRRLNPPAIARKLGIARVTVHRHIANAKAKLEAAGYSA